MNETLDSFLHSKTLKDFQIKKYLIDGWKILKTRFFWLFILSIGIAGFNILCQGILSWYWLIVIPVFLYPLLYAAIYGLANGARQREHLESDDFFVGIEHFASLGYARFIQTSLQIILLFPSFLLFAPVKFLIEQASGKELSDNYFYIPIIVFVAVLIYVTIAYIFTDQYIIFKGNNYWEAMTNSRKRVNKQFGRVFLLILIINIIAFLIVAILFLFYIYIQFINNFDEGSFIDFLKNITQYSFNPESIVAAITGIICLSYPYIYSVLHAAFADIEDLPTEETFDIEPS